MFKFIELQVDGEPGTSPTMKVIQVSDIRRIEPRDNRDTPEFPKAWVQTRQGDELVVSSGKGYVTLKQRLTDAGYAIV